jgi:CHAT domain-containing protein/tetratricopeptide (TPR) repeat protein
MTAFTSKRFGIGFWIVLLAAVISAGSANADEAFDQLVQLEKRFNALRSEGRFREAIPVAEELVAVAQRDFSDRPLLVVAALNHLGDGYFSLGRYEDSVNAYGESLTLGEQKLNRDGVEVATTANLLANTYFAMREFDQAEKFYLRSMAIREKLHGHEHAETARVYHNLAGTYMAWGRYADAEKNYRVALEISAKTIGLEHFDAIDTLNNLGLLFFHQARYAESERYLLQALAARKKLVGGVHSSVADTVNNLGNLYYAQGRFAQAESSHKQALEIRRKSLGPQHADVGQSLHNLGMLCFEQDRLEEGLTLLNQALAIRQNALGPNHPDVADTLNSLGNYCTYHDRTAEAEKYYLRSDEIFTQAFGKNHPRVALNAHTLGVLYQQLKRYDEAENQYQRALAIYQKSVGADHPYPACQYYKLAQMRLEQGKPAEALELATKNIDTDDRFAVNPGTRSSGYQLRAKIQRALGKPDEAVADLTRAIELIEENRGKLSGSEQDRSATFEHSTGAYELMVSWQTDLGHFDQAYAFMERGRARSLVDQLQSQGIDLLADAPADVAAKLVRRDALAKQQIATLKAQLEASTVNKSLTPTDRDQQQTQLVEQLAQAQAAEVEVYRDMRNVSPAYRLAVSQDYRPLPLAELQAWVADRKGLLLEYMIGFEESFVLVVSPSEATFTRLTLDDKQAKACGAEPGPLTIERLNQLWALGQTSLTQSLGNPQANAATTDRLALLWEVLVPPKTRALLTGNECQRLFIVPDGKLNALPFDALVVEGGARPKYLVDVGPPTIYAPSATVLVNLATRQASKPAGAQPVLTVADAIYQPGAGVTGAPETGDELLASARARYWDGSGPLNRLPYTATESNWVAKNFKQHGIAAAGLRGALATEANVRANAKDRQILHFACHGLVDQKHGNFFGALALTPGRAAAGTDDDGFLTLPEIYALKLTGCELAILSACQTNVGPQQRGEGLYGLSRGFLVAGSRRVVASNWLVDDESAASLVSYFAAGLAKTESESSQLDYAATLHAAKRWVRSQEKWNRPYYWATFVLIGPN